jgi:hypothetical protein
MRIANINDLCGEGLMMKTKTAIAAAIISLMGFGIATPVQAAFSECDANRSCMWGNNDFVFLIGERAPGGGLVNLTGDRNDQMDSWGNRTTTNSAGFGNANGGGDCQTFTAGQRDNDVAFFNSDEVSSWKTNGGC